MKKELELQLVEKYPTMFADYGKSSRESCMHWGMAHGDGWFFILETVCKQIANHEKNINYWQSSPHMKNTNTEEKYKDYEPFKFEQIKEKFGQLTLYYSGGDDFCQGICSMASHLSAFICEECGERGTLKTTGWMTVICKECDNKRKAKK